MNYGEIVRRAANMVWNHKFLMILGFLAALGGGGTFNLNFNSNNGGGNFDPGQIPGVPEFPFEGPFPGSFEATPRLSAMLVIVLCIGVLLALILFVVSNVARGGMIAAVDGVEEGRRASFDQAWSAGWDRLWTLLGIGILPAIPFFVLFLSGVLGFAGMMGIRAINVPAASMGVPFGGLLAALSCLLVPVGMILGLLRSFANRAAMLEGLGAVNAYGRGFSVLMDNLGEAIVLFLFQIAISIGLGLLLFLPGIIAALCCLLWPLIILFQGAIAAFFSTLWTLAWREWTGEGRVGDKVKTVY